MARIGVNYYDISKAAELIRKKGEEPTIDRVREHLGTGSKSTIAPLLKRWRSLQTEPADPEALPEELLETVKLLHLRFQQKADEKIDEYRKKFESAEAQTNTRLEEAETALAQLASDKKTVDMQNSELEAAVTYSQSQLDATRLQLAKTEANHEDANKRIKELKSNIEELKQDNRVVRDHFEHYQERVAEDRNAEREQHRLVLASAQEQIRQLQITLSQTEYKQAQLQNKLEEFKDSYTTLEKANSNAEATLSIKERDNQQLTFELEALKLQHSDLMQDNHQQREEKIRTTTALNAANKDISILNQNLATAIEEAKRFKDHVTELTLENKQILQEKALLQGKFNQLQESI